MRNSSRLGLIPDNITEIRQKGFGFCSNLISVTYKGIESTSKSALETALTHNGVTLVFDVFHYITLTD